MDARLPRPDSALVTDPLVAGLLASGELRSQPVTASDGTTVGAGQLVADSRTRAVRADGTVHPHRHLVGPAVSGSAGAGGFSRPHFNGPGFRQNDAVARDLLTTPIAAHGPGAPLRAPTATPFPHHTREVTKDVTSSISTSITTAVTTSIATSITTDKEHRHAS